MLKTPVPSTICGDGQGAKIRPFFLMLFFVVVSPQQQEGKTNIKRQKLKISKKEKDHATWEKESMTLTWE